MYIWCIFLLKHNIDFVISKWENGFGIRLKTLAKISWCKIIDFIYFGYYINYYHNFFKKFKKKTWKNLYKIWSAYKIINKINILYFFCIESTQTSSLGKIDIRSIRALLFVVGKILSFFIFVHVISNLLCLCMWAKLILIGWTNFNEFFCLFLSHLSRLVLKWSFKRYGCCNRTVPAKVIH